MKLYNTRFLANGLGTDHPLPDLPFVDDSHLPLDEPGSIEAIGRRHGTGMWGRQDTCRSGGWAAFTTEPSQPDLAWSIRWHPDHGRSVVLVSDEDASGLHVAWQGRALLFRGGGYWWDGDSWFRPSQMWDRAREEYVARPVPAAASVTALDVLPARSGRIPVELVPLAQIDMESPSVTNWGEHLALWMTKRSGGLPLEECIVNLTAPELLGDQLIGAGDLAEIAGVAPSTLRAYIARGEGDVPAPQAQISGRNVWARKVAEEWAESRRQESAGDVVATGRVGGAPVAEGVAELVTLFSKAFLARLWQNPSWRSRWALRWRTESRVAEVADQLAWDVASSLDRIVPANDLAITLRHAVLDDLRESQRMARAGRPEVDDDPSFYGMIPSVARMLDWFIRHQPHQAAYLIAEIIGEADRELGIKSDATQMTLRSGLGLDGKLSAHARKEYLDRAFGDESPLE